MARETETRIRVREMIPVFQLMATDGRTVSTWEYKGRKNMVLVFVPGDHCPACIEFLKSSSQMYHQYDVENAVLVTIVQGGQEQANELRDELDPPFPILYDSTGLVTGRYTDTLPAVFVADRFGQLYAQWISEPECVLPTQKQVLDVVELINLECPECGPPVSWA